SVSSLLLVIAAYMLFLLHGSLALADALLLHSTLLLVDSLLLCSSLELMVLASSLLFSSLALKIALAPLHAWLPEVYDGILLALVALLASAIKAALLLWLCSALYALLPSSSLLLSTLLVALTSMVSAASAAYAQLALKRLFALASTVHAGFLLAAITAYDALGLHSFFLYVLVYSTLLLILLLCLGALNALNHSFHTAGSSRSLRYIAQYAGLYNAQALLASSIILLLFNLAGLPPFIGFHAKLGLVLTLLSALASGYAFLLLFIKALSTLYYLRLISLLLLSSASSSPSLLLVSSLPCSKALLALSLLCLLSLFFYAKPSLLFFLYGCFL
ncbi:MAG: proton-conducting transporter membrane subunit, partial [Myxococcota bacterium]